MDLRQAGVTDARLLSAVEGVPRGRFVPLQHADAAYAGVPLPLDCGQTLPPALVTAQIVAAADVRSQHSVLDIGTGSGYQAALLARLARKVHSVERYAGLARAAGQRLQALGVANVIVHHADGRAGLNGQGLFDRIVSDSAFPTVPRFLLEHLVSGGSVVCPIGGPGEVHKVARFAKVGSRFERTDLFDGRFGFLQPGVATAL